jgi:hypothetical protein
MKTNDKKPEIQTKPEPFKYRYFCPACTGVAFYSVDIDTPQSTCAHCGAKLGEIKKENFIKL